MFQKCKWPHEALQIIRHKTGTPYIFKVTFTFPFLHASLYEEEEETQGTIYHVTEIKPTCEPAPSIFS